MEKMSFNKLTGRSDGAAYDYTLGSDASVYVEINGFFSVIDLEYILNELKYVEANLLPQYKES